MLIYRRSDFTNLNVATILIKLEEVTLNKKTEAFLMFFAKVIKQTVKFSIVGGLISILLPSILEDRSEKIRIPSVIHLLHPILFFLSLGLFIKTYDKFELIGEPSLGLYLSSGYFFGTIIFSYVIFTFFIGGD